MLDYLSNRAIPKGVYEFDVGSPTPDVEKRRVGPGTSLLFSVRGHLIAECIATTEVDKNYAMPRVGIKTFRALLDIPENLIIRRKERGRGLYYPRPNEQKLLLHFLKLKSVEKEPRRIKAGLKLAQAKARGYFQRWLRDRELERFGRKCTLCDIGVESLLKTSHIIPVEKNLQEAGNENNALLLCSLHDSLFENGLIAVGASGRVDLSPSVEWEGSGFLNFVAERLVKDGARSEVRKTLMSSKRFLEWHRKRKFKRS